MADVGLNLKSTILSDQDLRTVASPTFAGLTITGTNIITDIRWNVTKLQYKKLGDDTWYDVPTV